MTVRLNLNARLSSILSLVRFAATHDETRRRHGLDVGHIDCPSSELADPEGSLERYSKVIRPCRLACPHGPSARLPDRMLRQWPQCVALR